MAINFSENLKIGYPASIRTTDVVGVNVQGLPPSTYADKDAIPTYMRSLYMKVTDQNGVEWRLEDATDLTVWTEIVAPTGGGDTTKDITASIAVGALGVGDVVPLGTNLTTFVETLVSPRVLATYDSNGVVLNGISNSTLEVGTPITASLTAVYHTGIIHSKDGHPDVPLTGAATTAQFSGAGVGATDGVINTEIALGANRWSVIQDFAVETAAYYDSRGDASTNLDSLRGPGSANDNSNTITGKYKYWFSAGTAPTTSADVRALASNGYFPVNVFNIVIPANVDIVSFYLPHGQSIVVQYKESSYADVTSTFTEAAMNIVDGGTTSHQYSRFETTIAGGGYPSQATYIVTIN